MSVSDKIIQINSDKSNPLRLHCLDVKKSEFDTKELKNILLAMKKALNREDDGVAIAAPQIGISKKIFIIKESSYKENIKWKPLIFINPKIIKFSKKKAEMQEGCLSVRWVYGKTKRSVSVTIEAYDEFGTKFSYGASDLIAHIFQHEIDHLNGILFIDHGYDLEEFTEEDMRNANKKTQP